MSDPSTTSAAITLTWRAESARLVGALTRMTRDIGLAEDLAQDALVAALEQWPRDGIPERPGAWLMTAARRRALDHFRRAETLRRKTELLGRPRGEEDGMPDLASQVEYIEDDALRLMFLCAHPALTPQARAALTLRLVGGLSTAEIARGFLTTEPTMRQRISRAKKALTDARVDFELPTGADRTRRLDDVMAVIYLVFNEGYAASAGPDWVRPDLVGEAIRLARLLVDLAPDEPEALGLLALLELQGSRLPARLTDDGAPVLLEDQDRTRWDHVLIAGGLAALHRARAIAARGRPVSRYFLQAEIAAQHARATRSEETDWRHIARLYDTLADAAPGPVVEVNRAVAHGRAFGSDAGLTILDALDPEALGDSPLIPSVRGDLLERAARNDEAATAFALAATRTRNDAERALLLRRAEANRDSSAGSGLG